MQNKKAIELQNMLFDKQDIILVSVPTQFKILYDYVGKEGDLGGVSPAGKIFELAILNKSENRFVLFRELPTDANGIKIICDVADFVPKTATGEFDFVRPNFVVENQNNVSTIFSIPKVELEQGILYDTLASINTRYVQLQIKNYQAECVREEQRKKRLQFLNECRECYKDF